MSDSILFIIALTPVVTVGLFCVFFFQFNKQVQVERDELTKKIMAKNLSEYQQTEMMRQQINSLPKVEPKKDPLADYIPIDQLDNDPEALENIHNHINSLTGN